MHVDVAWRRESVQLGTETSEEQASQRAGLFTGSKVALDDHLVLLLVSSCDDEVVLRADEPQELLKPAAGVAP